MSAYSREPEDNLSSYLSRLTQAPLLTPEEELSLATAAQKGDATAKDRLVESNMRLVITIARGYRSRQIPLEDLIQEGAIGLMQAADRFDPKRGFRFSTYATHWIRQAIGRAIDNKAKSIRLPAYVAQSLRKIEKERADFQRRTGYEPTPEQLAHALGITVKKLNLLLSSSQELVSLETRVGENGSSTLGGVLKDETATDAEDHMMSQAVLSELQKIMKELNEREQRVLQVKYRIDGDLPAEAADVEQELSITRDRLRQIEAQAIRKLRQIVQNRRLGEMFDRELPDAL